MRFIAHRGNVAAKSDNKENHPEYIDQALDMGFDVEIDVSHVSDNDLYLGHDGPDFKVNIRWIINRQSRLWIHCKTVDVLHYFHSLGSLKHLNYFFHGRDMATLTSLGHIWAFPGVDIPNSIAVLPEWASERDLSDRSGICSDYIGYYRREYGENKIGSY